jgi:hypothetical protein
MQNTDTGLIFTTERPDFWRECKRLPVAAGKAAMKAQAIEYLHGLLKPGSEVLCSIRNVSRSGMSRRIDFYTVSGGDLVMLTHKIADATDNRVSDKGGLIIGGCGMDMGFAVVYHLGAVMWPNGTPEPHGRRNGEPDSEGGYALKHRWM